MTDTPPAFPGFAAGSRATTIPNSFFSDVLPCIDDPAEMVVTCYLFFAVGRSRDGRASVTAESLRLDPALRRATARLPGGADDALARGLAAAVRRGTALARTDQHGVRYAVNTASGRRALGAAGEPAQVEVVASGDPDAAPTIFALYEQAIGTLSPLIADELRAVEGEYPSGWIAEAFREAAAQNKRSWRYVARILQRWRDEGRHDATVGRDAEARADLAGRYRGLVRR